MKSKECAISVYPSLLGHSTLTLRPPGPLPLQANVLEGIRMKLLAALQTPPRPRTSGRPAVINPTVFGIAAAGKPLGRDSSEQFADKVPKTAANFHALNTGEKGFSYKGSCFHRIIPGCTCQGGDLTCHTGMGGKSIYGEKCDDENFTLNHTSSSILSTVNAAPHADGSQLFIRRASTWSSAR